MAKNLIFALLLSLPQAALAETGPAVLTQIDFIFDNKITHTRDLPSATLQATRKRMVAGGAVSTGQLRALADAGDGLAAYRYGRFLQAKVPPAKSGSAAHYYAMAAYTGRAFAVTPLAKLLLEEGTDYSPSLLRHSLNAMTVQAISGNTKAAQYLSQMYAAGAPFGHDLRQAQHFMAMAGQNDPAAALKLGLVLMADPADMALDHIGARAALTLAAEGSNFSARVTAQNLLRLLDTPATLITKATP